MPRVTGKGATLYLRGLPEAMVREAKAAAARRGITLAALVVEALKQTLPAETPAREADDLAHSMAWFQTHRARLLRRYRGQYVAILGERVIDQDRDFHALATRVFRRLGPRPVFMPKVTEEERAVRLPSPSVVTA